MLKYCKRTVWVDRDDAAAAAAGTARDAGRRLSAAGYNKTKARSLPLVEGERQESKRRCDAAWQKHLTTMSSVRKAAMTVGGRLVVCTHYCQRRRRGSSSNIISSLNIAAYNTVTIADEFKTRFPE